MTAFNQVLSPSEVIIFRSYNHRGLSDIRKTPMDPTQALLFILVAIVLGWFAVGVIWNIRRGNAVLKWMQAGLPRLGEKTTLRWLGSSAVELALAKAKPPFRRVELVVVLEPRDVPWFWAMARWQRRRDMLIVRGQLQNAPPFEYDLIAPDSWSARMLGRQNKSRPWETETLQTIQFRAPASTRSLSRQTASSVLQTAQQSWPTVWRLSVQRESPQLELHMPLPNPNRDDARQFFDALTALAEQLSQR